jgi:hypothetical protein
MKVTWDESDAKPRAKTAAKKKRKAANQPQINLNHWLCRCLKLTNICKVETNAST